MMNAESSAHNHKDFLNAFFQPEQPPARRHSIPAADIYLAQDSQHLPPALMNSQQQSMPGGGVSMDVLEGLMGMQERGGQSAVTAGTQPTPQMLMEHQMRLNQLQQLYQLQAQIFQQQIELLSGGASLGSLPVMLDRYREQQQYLPTPAQSTEIPPQPSPNFVPPMLLQSSDQNNTNMQQQNFMQQHGIPSAPHSAPANIVFQNIQSPYPLPSPADLDFDDMSPLTSPWLGAYNNNQSSATGSSSRHVQQGASTGTKRRTASPSSDEMNSSGRPSRKRQAAVNRLPQNMPTTTTSKKSNIRGTKSASSTPLFPAMSNRSGGSRRGIPSPVDVPVDTPSPVDLSMPPPATPQPLAPMNFLQPNNSGSAEAAPSQAPASQEHITPVTPASIMNIGRLAMNSVIVPAPQQPSQTSSRPVQEKATKSRASSRPRSATVSGQASTSKNMPGNGPIISPALKPIRPAGNASVTGSVSPIAQIGQPILQVRKTSHKAAEQKRRDSLKTSFDDLRMLLPPIPLPSEEGYADEPILPGAMPPRGPPKGNADGPNRGVSKLQLLRCGNDYIKRLKGRVERRDEEIEKLRKELGMLRVTMGSNYIPEDGQEPVDLEKDLDAVEASLGPLGRYPGSLLGGDDRDDEEDIE